MKEFIGLKPWVIEIPWEIEVEVDGELIIRVIVDAKDDWEWI